MRAYLDVSEIIRVAKLSGADAIYPGYGFLSENPDLAQAAADAGITFIGPPTKVLEMAGNKVTAKEHAIAAGVPILPTILWGSQRVICYTHRKPLTQRRLPITIMIGEPLTFTEDEGVAAATRRLRTVMNQMLVQAQESYPDRPSGPDDSWWLPTRMGGTAPTPEEGQAMANARRKKAEQP